MILMGLTGGIGMGKSTAARILAGKGIPIVDTDQLARDVVEPGCPALAKIVARFGPGMIASDGRLRREELARVIFADDTQRRALEEILHPRIRESWRARVADWRTEGRVLGVVVIPLLFETGAAPEFDRTVCTACSAGTQRQRLAERGWPATEIEQRIAAQWPTDRKMAQSHHVIWTEAGLDIHEAQWDLVLSGLLNPPPPHGTPH